MIEKLKKILIPMGFNCSRDNWNVNFLFYYKSNYHWLIAVNNERFIVFPRFGEDFFEWYNFNEDDKIKKIDFKKLGVEYIKSCKRHFENEKLEKIEEDF